MQKFSSWSDLTDALHAGKIDGASELIELAMSAKGKGVDLQVAALGHRDGNVIVVNDTIQDAADMKGKTFAIPSTQSSHYILLQELLDYYFEAGEKLDKEEGIRIAETYLGQDATTSIIRHTDTILCSAMMV